MFGLNVKVTALLFNVMVIQGKIFREDLQDENYSEHYQSINSDFPRSDYFDNALESFKTDFDVGPELPNLKLRVSYDYSRFIVGRKMIRDWFSKLTNPDYKQPFDPINHVEPIRPTRPIGQGRIGYPVRRKPGTNDWNKMCQNIKGLPTPESGCCGVQVTRQLRQRYPNTNKPRWSEFQGGRFGRSIDNQEPPMKMINGGRATDLHHLPWMAHLVVNPRQRQRLHRPETCGATIISSRYVLTAAHCLYNRFKDISQLEVILAEYDTDSYPEDCIERAGATVCMLNEVMKVDYVRLHENYNDTYLNNDIALLRLISDISYTQFIRPICLPTADIEDLRKEDILIAGWGLNGNTESHLKQVAYVNYVSNEKCKEQYPYKDDSMVCSIGDHGEDICKGDSGGPLMVVLNKQYFLSGIANGKAKDNRCGSSFSSLFNNVFYHRDWIVKHVN